ncbi:hypothetical protein VaNZ11_007211, partial [Volvox africanus]
SLMLQYIVWTAGLMLAIAVGCNAQDVFSEELLTAWVSPQHLLVHFRFDQGTTASRLHTSFPHAIQQLASTLRLHAVELSLTSGRWRYTTWGRPLVAVTPVGAVLDASLRAGLKPQALIAHWAALVNALSGLSCASFSLLHDPTSISGGGISLRQLLAPTTGNRSAEGPVAGGQRLRAMLPHEPLCTENLTPWLRLLPCRDQAGLASLLRHRPTVFGAEYVSLGLMLERHATPKGRRGVRLVQTVTLVIRTALKRAQQQQQAHPSAPGADLETVLGARVEHFCPPAMRSEVLVAEPDSPEGLFATWRTRSGGVCCESEDESQNGSCPLGDYAAAATTGTLDAHNTPGPVREPSRLLLPVMIPAGSPGFAVEAVSQALPALRRYDTLELLEVGDRALGLQLPYPHPQPSTQPHIAGVHEMRANGDDRLAGPDLQADRYVTGANLLHGAVVLRIQRSRELRARLEASQCTGWRGSGGAEGGGTCGSSLVCINQLFPWYVRPWMHTLTVLYDGQEVPLRPHLVAQQVRPAVQRSSPGVVDLCLRVPPAVAEVQLRVAFSKAFLTVFEYPPDAHRGFDVPAAVVSYLDPLYAPAVQWRVTSPGDVSGAEVVSSPLLSGLSAGPVKQVYTVGLLVPLAAPDFSMPYNVICLSSTVLAVYFGALLNLLTRRGCAAGHAAPERSKVSLGGKALQALLMLVLFSALALYLDAELRQHAMELLAKLGFPLEFKLK